MIEIVIGTSINAEGEATFGWSVWNNEEQIGTGHASFLSASECEANAVDYCWRALGYKPDKVTRL